MTRPRIIPILGIQNKKLVKTIKYKKPNYLGDPINAIKIFNDKEVDELAVIDIRATVNKQEPNYLHLEEMAGEAFMPMAYGGGIDTFDKAKRIFDCGFEKVILNSGYFINADLAKEISETYGAQSVVLSLDLKTNLFGKLICTTHSGKTKIKSSFEQIVNSISHNYVGEVILNDISRDGTFLGYNLGLINKVSKSLPIPVIANLGANSINNFKEALQAGASAVAASSMFVYRNRNPNSILISYQNIS